MIDENPILILDNIPLYSPFRLDGFEDRRKKDLLTLYDRCGHVTKEVKVWSCYTKKRSINKAIIECRTKR